MGIKMDNMPPDLRKACLDQMGKDNVGLVRNRTGPKPPGTVTPKCDLEGAVQKECLDLLEGLSIMAWRENTGAVKIDNRFIRFGRKGKADILGLLPNGRFLAIEAKRRYGGVQSDDQKVFQDDIESSKGVYLLVHSAGELLEKLRKVM